MLTYFNKNYLSRYLALLLIAFIYRLPSLLNLDDISTGISNEDQFIFSLGFFNPYVLWAASLFITFLTALLLNQIASEYSFSGSLTTRTAFYYLLLACSLPAFILANHLIAANFLLLFIYRDLFGLPKTSVTIPSTFNASFLAGLASFFYLPLIFFILVIWYGLISHRISSWRNYVVSLIGLSIPYVFLFTWFFLTDNLKTPVDLFVNFFQSVLQWKPTQNYFDLAIAVVLFLIVILSILKITNRPRSGSINLRRDFEISLFSLFVLTLIVFVFETNLSNSILLVIPSTLIISSGFNEAQPGRKITVVLYSLMFILLINQYFSFFTSF